MNKSLVALAVLAASGAAMAQSSVTLYGRLDASFGQTSTETTGGAAGVAVNKVTQTGVSSSAMNTTYWGMKGTEDLGGGLKANFVLQNGFAIDTGVSNTGFFEREAHVGLAGNFGEVQLGRVYTSLHSVYGGVSDMLWDNNFSVMGTVYNLGVSKQGVRTSNGIRYDSPSMSGFTASVTAGFGEDKSTTANVGSATDDVSFNLQYANGPVYVGYAHGEKKLAQAVATTAQVTNKYDVLAGRYDFGVLALTGQYSKAKNGTNDDTEYQVGVTVPVSSTDSFGIGYAHAKTTAAAAADLNAKGFGLTYMHDMSKRTTLYVGYNATQVEKTPANIATDKATSLQAGVRHLF